MRQLLHLVRRGLSSLAGTGSPPASANAAAAALLQLPNRACGLCGAALQATNPAIQGKLLTTSSPVQPIKILLLCFINPGLIPYCIFSLVLVHDFHSRLCASFGRAKICRPAEQKCSAARYD